MGLLLRAVLGDCQRRATREDHVGKSIPRLRDDDVVERGMPASETGEADLDDHH